MIRVLVIDDDSCVRESILEVLGARGYQALAADGADAGLAKALRHVPDLVISDIMMPGKDGYSLLSEFRANPATAAIPFILMTGVDNPDRYRAGMNLGADDYLPKPFTGEQLDCAVKACIKKNRLVASRADEKVANLLNILETTLPHELRTPLNGILGFSEMLKVCSHKFSASETVQAAEYINISAKRLHRLIENLLLSARLRVMRDEEGAIGRLNTDETIDLLPLVDRLAKDYATQYDRLADLKITAEGEVVCSDPQLVCKAIEELIDNAFKFSNSGTPVNLSMGRDESGARIVIEDRGRGMDEEHVTQVDVFRQFDRSHFEQQGAGLGMFIAKQVVFELGGDFEIASHPGQGTSIVLSLPSVGKRLALEDFDAHAVDRIAV